MRRRTVSFGLLTGLLWPGSSALGQETGRLRKVAFLSPATFADSKEPRSTLNSLLRTLGELGYADGQNISLEFRFANHALERLPSLAAELVASRPDVLWTFTSGGARAVAAVTTRIPVVVAPVNEGTMLALVSNFDHPAGNVTGLTLNSLEQHEKCLQLLKEAAPSAARVGVLVNPLNPVWQDYPLPLEKAGRILGLTLIRVAARGGDELDQAFAAVTSRIDGLFALSDSTLMGTKPTLKRIVDLAAELKLASVSDEGTEFARLGGLLTLGTDYLALGHRAALYIHRILEGEKPGDLPVQRPTKFVVAVNPRTAAQLGITIPPSILLRADEVIE